MDPSSLSSVEIAKASTRDRSEAGAAWAAARRAKAETEEDLDMTPMVDVTFLLLIFFMITAAFALQKAIAVPPTSDEQATAIQTRDDPEEDSVVVRLDSDNVFWVVCPAWPDEERAVSKQDMRRLVQSARNGADPGSTAKPDGRGFPKLLVQASGDATHEFVVAALDAGSGAGVEEIRLMRVDDEY